MDDLTREEMAQLICVYRDQSLQIIEEMCQDLCAVERGGFDGETASRLKRAAHTLKGDSACIGLDNVAGVAHKLEDMLEGLRGVEGEIERAGFDAILAGLDAIRDAIATGEVADIAPEVSGAVVDGLERAAARICEPAAVRKENPISHTGSLGNEKLVRERNNSGGRETVRVEAAKVDGLLDLAGEMVISRSAITQLVSEVEAAMPRSELVARLKAAGADMGKLIGELQKSVLKMRMVTIEQVFRRFARPMRELAETGGKLVELKMEGSETELDRAVVDLLHEPLLHLLRNAVDHGIEKRDERVACGKPERGTISIRACHEGNQVVIEVTDDGRGIDTAGLRARAAKAGAITVGESEGMCDVEALDLLFLEGVSTASELTRVSGRGVGAFAVKRMAEQLRGSASVSSVPGKGTRFTLRLPMTLAIVRALLFESSGQLLAVPLMAAEEITRAGESDLFVVGGFESYRLRDRLISIVRPGEALGLDRRRGGPGAGLRGKEEGGLLIVIKAGEKRYGVLSEALLGEQELVVKPLEGRWVRSDALAGASILGDGRVALIIDAEGLFRMAVRLERDRRDGKAAYA